MRYTERYIITMVCCCDFRIAPVIYLLCFYCCYMILVFPIMEFVGWCLRYALGYEFGPDSPASKWIYFGCLLMFIPMYIGLFYWSWVKHRAKQLFTPKWKTNEPLDEEDVLCTICYEIIVNPRTLRCQHSFCKKCIDQCLPQSRRCPSCQQWVYWSSRNKLFKSKVLRWVKENGREEEYKEVVAIKKEQKVPKIGFWKKFWPMIVPFLEVHMVPREDRRARRVRGFRLRRANVEPVAPAQAPQTLIVNVIDEMEDVDDQELDVASVNPPVAALHIPMPTIVEVPETSGSQDSLECICHTFPDDIAVSPYSDDHIVASSSSLSSISSHASDVQL
ncbi:hypothetical protein B9Z55_010893 [Caenorhabditis nigoni]|uniref:RING-type E3 ubiquitin transferase n=1 Tax=Caenorhabditis nigoni TaxID=1611254 RepID=A0A2G5UHQ7_9PELO|nr:hypothetical protein B9Z55_010893 [Caenorhabditis nigoni]